ncbi:MAG: uroporphyrinogen decarboxylase [Clostridiales bacterium]|nr:uroporphyrinogen decarboxylase [Clostridiales bacterium]
MENVVTSMERVRKTMNFCEPDRVPFFLLCTHYCAKLLDMPIEEYFSKPEHVVKGQLLLKNRYHNDCVNPFYSVGHEYAAFGGEIIFHKQGPPNAGEPIIKHLEDIERLQPPDIKSSKSLMQSLKTITLLKEEVGESTPILGAVVSPFTYPILQMGFDKYIELIYERPDLLDRLLRINEIFCTEWANLQLRAGASFITWIDSMAAPSILPKERYLRTGYLSAKRTIAKIQGEVAIATSSASTDSILEEILSCGIKGILVSHFDDMEQTKKKVDRRATLLGNLNGIDMCNWTRADVEAKVVHAMKQAGTGGGFILCDNIGDIPYQVSEDTLFEISECVKHWGRYPLIQG